MDSRARVMATLEHLEPDRIPFDLGGAAQSGMHTRAYASLRHCLGLPETAIALQSLIGQTAEIDEDLLDRLCVDTRLVRGGSASNVAQQVRREGDYLTTIDEWGVAYRMPVDGGLYFDICASPFDLEDVTERLTLHAWPDPVDPNRFRGMHRQAAAARQKGKLVSLNGLCAGILEVYSWLRGYPRFFTDLATAPKTVELFLDKLLELKLAYWEQALDRVGQDVSVIDEADDMAGQSGLLMSPTTYRRLIKPRHRELFAAIKRMAPHVKIYFHSCGAIRPLIPDLIEIGVDILNPVQISAKGMDPFELKRDFGNDIVFWGGGVDTQGVLCSGTPQEVRENVRRNIDALAPGGGFVFAAVHITQANVPPENFMAMWETLQEYGVY